MRIIDEKRTKQKIVQKTFVLFLFIAYFVLGIFIYRDYGISTDEPNERESTFRNIKYVLDTFDIDTLHGADGDLENYRDRYYGVAIQVLPALVEWHMDFPGGPTIYYVRHLWTFLLCFIGYICFYLMCREVFKARWLSLLGTAMLALYPRFFAEQFYNIKDMIFASMVMVSMFVTVKVIESKYSVLWALAFGMITALTTNVRMVGMIFPILLLGYLWLIGILQKCKIQVEDNKAHILRTSILIIIGYVVSYFAMFPILWKNPLEQIMKVFVEFSDYVWNGTIVFMGDIIGASELPWYYIPVWLLISLPVWYVLLLALTTAIIVFALIGRIRKKEKICFLSTLFQYKYAFWSALIAFLPWIGAVLMHSTLYNGWRHFYFALPPIVFAILSGLDYVIVNFDKSKLVTKGIIIISVIGLLLQSIWIIKNHPYEMVYLNAIGRIWGADFDRDYWSLSSVELSRYILEHDDSEKISLEASNDVFMRFLPEEERNRIVLEENGTYYIESYRGKVGNEIIKEGYEEYYSITVDGYRIATIFRKKGIDG